ncbi:hypothetical protein B566_EDAN012822 [Ephemera danica]|nr:hypothetical protein B566_EDAN012822 [Ephemera danica]
MTIFNCLLQLRNIQSVIRLTRKNIDALNARFAGFQHPPSMYLKEYHELTSKLHEFELRETELVEQLSNGRDSPQDSTDDSCGQAASQGASGDASPMLAPRSPLKSVVRAHLPNQQRTSVQVRRGLTVREALSKAMKLRKLSPDTCMVYRGDTKVQVPWDADISALEGEEISVEMNDDFPITTSISHNYVRKTFFSLAFCECCRKLLFQGFYCRTCGYKFHQRCAARVPALCQQVRMQHTYLQILLAQSPDSAAGILHTGSYLTHPQSYPSPPTQLLRRHPHTLGQRERSTSAPNVCFNLVGQSSGMACDVPSLEEFASHVARSSNLSSPVESCPHQEPPSFIPPLLYDDKRYHMPIFIELLVVEWEALGPLSVAQEAVPPNHLTVRVLKPRPLIP